DRIEKTVLKYRKPFFFAEAGCMSRKGSGMVPNNWELQGELRLEEQSVLMGLISVMTDCFFYSIINS
ncbi:glycoside hydrolase family 113, partial [Blautia massiliensis (ex Durand et al. 2017)]|uniref:glycoside hydrolase family 113 n=1 Tax=Blautia massiliensis (ex Durand et al. 2017) TaxID=1737424 RepID=UPI002ED5127F